ncbi:monofunctional biosynthetic peptidoglycan transglycosylase [Xylella fastidiosa subsp. morus]|uniref:Biosynthetic peptidoglycan transglycosylase n=3 Tax=Xylella fastidiosa TaxID=2371 RepID=MTGA_XYLFT|nr:monofunctional biosynthetic peptidoglycan transglycosylase [Xylella fastidiosa]B2I5D0.1 RecName: Full=Biosynthetic peptidoglycan transglycosylase; AltName: Full=Glycan polymerase; AltName: Full=Peptidoglycan glycosyltransferase MtgA; Short=PGT [Xylella fastidiosa M23]Q87CI7.2 RecName: Full=Biosynthetic peptidoglycan transglycosylase; AltName: Full=Glycan polymerase; AltName: Full=Peptidoglycan glycosyltransferase MtgA; Short=PGT [Xylella fastidiosa Temecula1]KAF0570273.1 peptidoglycan transgl
MYQWIQRDSDVHQRWIWCRRLLIVSLVSALMSVLQVIVFRFVDPPLSMTMVGRYLEAWSDRQWNFRLHYVWCDLEQIAPSVPISLVAAEDQRFPFHHGFDFDAIKKALGRHSRGGHLRGASTISQQVAKNLFLWSGRSFVRKGLEGWYTFWIELFWPKRRILEIYANIAEFGDGVYGVQAAARRYLGKGAADLDESDAAQLAAVLPSPRHYNIQHPGPYIRWRSSWIQRQAKQLGGSAYLDMH